MFIYLQDGNCHADKVPSMVNLTSYSIVTPFDQEALTIAIAKGPVAVAIDVSHRSFSFYSDGVYNEPECGM